MSVAQDEAPRMLDPSVPGDPSGGTGHPSQPSAASSTELRQLVDRIPDGWTTVAFEGRRYALTRTSRVGGRSVKVYAEELGGSDLISANVYQTSATLLLRSCEIPDAKVLAFLRGWSSEEAPQPPDAVDASSSCGESS